MTANVTNTVALVLNAVGSVSASRPELRGQGRRLLPLMAAALLGGIVGAALLLLTPSATFEAMVPWLIAAASMAILVRRPPPARATTPLRQEPRGPRWLAPGTFAIGIYGGYFGAAAGVLMLALFLVGTGEGLPRSNALKNVVLGLANAVAALGYVVFASVAWAAAAPLAAGFLVGGRIGPRVVRRTPQVALRRIIAVARLALAVHLGVQAYG